MNLVKTSYSENDVKVLLKDLTGQITALDTKEREILNQSGTHYSEMLPLEYKPTDSYIKIYEKELENNARKVAQAVVNLGNQIYEYKGKKVVLVSLARAGTPVGILLKRYFKMVYGFDCPHYSISIIRDRGLDKNAMKYILNKEKCVPFAITFIDGWVGKGAIQKELLRSVNEFYRESKVLLDPILAVLSDPAKIIPDRYCGTREDFIIPSCCLNATVSGLFSRTIRNKDLIKENDFDGAVYYQELESEDRSIEYLDRIEKEIKEILKKNVHEAERDILTGEKVVNNIAKDFDITDINKIKPGIGETTRVLLRRVPHIVLVPKGTKKDDSCLAGIYQLCKEKNVPIKEYENLGRYKAVGIIKDLSDL